ncbi:MAG: ABC transporter permease [Microscillaceae bacterium]|jgi:putative ABC transport system permease protein|nr:ABC transporter permease [Microscillaceae bacterium]
MNLFTISLNYIRRRWLTTLLNIILLAFGVGIMVFLLLVQHQFQEKFTNNVKGIKMVIGAKGSPLQLILCNIYHIDVPTGNIPLADAEQISQMRRFVKKAIPLALGDSYKNFRIVGTNHDYPQHYKAQIAQGTLWAKNLEVTIGAEVARKLNLKVGSKFAGAHGLEDSDMHHEGHLYQVVGILQANNSVLDRLILTNVESVWAVHDTHSNNISDSTAETPPKEITALLITQYTNPIAAINLPRIVNQIGTLQAAQPAIEINRLFELLGFSANVLQIFAYVIMGISALSIFIALFNALRERQYDLAIMRALGASRFKLFSQIILEGFLLAMWGALVGFALGHAGVAWIATWEDVADKIQLTGGLWLAEETTILALVLGLGLFSALLPAFQSYRVDIAETLAQ